MNRLFIVLLTIALSGSGCNNPENRKDSGEEIKLITLAPGHFHAALVQKSMYPQVSPEVHVYAPEGPEVKAYLDLIEQYNTQDENPTSWKEEVYTGEDFLDKMLREKPGNVVVLAGNNRDKTGYIKKAVDAGLHVLADKPMAINAEGFEMLQNAFNTADKKGLKLYDIMTERFEITTILQKELSQMPGVFGELQTGSVDTPAITKESVHHFYKTVSGKPLVRPAWFYDVEQQGEGIVDVTTHLVDLIQWACFPEQAIDYRKDISLLSAKHWATELTPGQFRISTGLDDYPEYLKKDLIRDSLLNVYANGEINYTIKDVHAKVSVIWNFKAPEGAGDTHYSIMRGSRANLLIRQGAEQDYVPELYIEPVGQEDPDAYEQLLESNLEPIRQRYPGVELERLDGSWRVVIPGEYREGHEAHFAQVTRNFLKYLTTSRMPDWEVPNMIAKYYVTTQALEMARESE